MNTQLYIRNSGRKQKPHGITELKDIVEWFLEKATRLPNGCLISHLKPNAKGYVYASIGGRKGKRPRLHRLVYTVLVAPVPDDLQVIHSCNCRNCIAVEHLRVGTPKENSADMIDGNRQANQYRVRLGWRD